MACDEAAPTIRRCVFVANTASIGGAVALLSTTLASPAVVDCEFTSNSASQQGAGIVCDGVLATFANSSFDRNIGLVQGGAVMCIGADTDVTFDGCTFTGNFAGSGGGVLVPDGRVTLNDCVLANNTATSSGGGLIASNEAVVTVNRCLFHGNSVGALILRASIGHTARLRDASSYRMRPASSRTSPAPGRVSGGLSATRTGGMRTRSPGWSR